MAKATMILIAFIGALIASTENSGQPHLYNLQQQASERAMTPQESAITVRIATVSSFLGPPTEHYKVGDQIPITIMMTNTSTGPLTTCISSDLYQNLPKLTKDGQPVPYMKWQSYERL
ncbi:MAG: hypothetical protein ND866_04155, partial [Pyrinomonadaceae bacterium]|nr:hypothetical protein [Pyrinomonadaceae bacterium]